MKTTWKFIYGTLFLSLCSLDLMAGAGCSAASGDSAPATSTTTVSRGAGICADSLDSFYNDYDQCFTKPLARNRHTPLQAAAEGGDVARCISIIAEGSSISGARGKTIEDVKVLSGLNTTLLCMATMSRTEKNVETVRVLADAGVNPNLYGSDGLPPLHWASRRADKPMCAALLRVGADPHYICSSDIRRSPPKSVLDLVLVPTTMVKSDEMKTETLITLLAAGVSPFMLEEEKKAK